MTITNLGDKLNQIISYSISSLFVQGELAHFSYNAFDYIIKDIEGDDKEEIEVQIPVGYNPNRETIKLKRTYSKSQITDRYTYLRDHEIAINGIYQLVTIIESLFRDIISSILMKYPNKIGTKKKIDMEAVLNASSIEEVHTHAIDSILNELSYKAPKDFADSATDIISVDLFKCLAFSKYIEIKATRDVYLHNQGIANHIYFAKADSHARFVSLGQSLQLDLQYFLESYEACIQLVEWLERELHKKWYSSEYDRRTNKLQQESNTEISNNTEFNAPS